MRLGSTATAVTTLTALVSMTLLGAMPVFADEPAPTPSPTETATATVPTPSATPAPSPTPEPTATPTAEPAGSGLDLKVKDKTTPLLPPIPSIALPFNLGSVNLSPQAAPATSNPQFGGSASGLYSEAFAGDDIRVKAGQLGAVSMKPDGALSTNTAARVFLPTLYLPVLIAIPILGINAEGITVSTGGGLSYPDKQPSATAIVKIVNSSNEVYAANVTAQGVHVYANVQRLANGEYKFTGTTDFAYLEVYGVAWGTNPAEPNQTQDVPGLGKVVVNEQKITDLPGDRHGIRVNAIHITLSTAKLGLPVGTDIYIGSAEAIIYDR